MAKRADKGTRRLGMQIFAWIISIGFLVWAIDEYARDAWRDGLAERSWRDEIRKVFLAKTDYLRIRLNGHTNAGNPQG
jgi:hypothetical protein